MIIHWNALADITTKHHAVTNSMCASAQVLYDSQSQCSLLAIGDEWLLFLSLDTIIFKVLLATYSSQIPNSVGHIETFRHFEMETT